VTVVGSELPIQCCSSRPNASVEAKLPNLDTKTLSITNTYNFMNYAFLLFHGGRRQDPEAKWCHCALHSPGTGPGGPWGLVLKGYAQF